MNKFYAIKYLDAREKRHVVAVHADTAQAALEADKQYVGLGRLGGYYYKGFYCD